MIRVAALLILAVLTLPIAFGCCLCEPREPPAKYAVLASTRMATPDGDVANNVDFWHDLVLTYCTLIDNGFEADNIFVLYGDGQDFSSLVDTYLASSCGDATSKITDIALTNPTGYDKANLCNILCCMSTGRPAEFVGGYCACKTSGGAGIGGFSCTEPEPEIPRLQEEDFLITWIKGHGATTDCKTTMTFASGTVITDSELASLFTNLRSRRRVLFFETCDARGWLDDFEGDDSTVVATSSGLGADNDCVETSYPAVYEAKNEDTGTIDLVLHGRFSYWMNAALRQKDLMQEALPSDTDENNLISIQEDFDAAKIKITAENAMPAAEFGGVMSPSILTPEGAVPCIFIRLPIPGNDDDVFSMDHPGDDGTIPSESVITDLSAMPDLWVRHSLDGGIEHQPPETSSENYINARVHNIGCADPGDVTVKFYWAFVDTPDDWTWIVDTTVETPLVGKPATVSALWKITDKPKADEGPYWLIATLSAGDDTPQDGKEVEMDNNKVRLLTEVVDP